MKPTQKTAVGEILSPKGDQRASDLFIVDNSEDDWKVARYLHDWCEIARAFDIATGYFEIGSLLALDGQWQKLDRIRVLMGDEVTLRTKQAFDAAFSRIQATLDDSLEREKEKNDFLKGVPAIVAALEKGQIACRVYTERKFHAKAYITHTKFEVMPPVALVGSSNFTYPGLHDNVELNIQVRHDVADLQAWYERYWEEAKDVTPDLLKVITRHTRDYSPFEVYAKALYEFFKGHALTATEWELTQSKIYPILDNYQREGYQALLKIAGQYNGALLCDGVGLGKTFIGLMLIERLVEHERQRVALIVPKAARKPVWESKLRRYLPSLGGVYSNLAVYNHTDLLRGNDYAEQMQEIQAKADVVIIDEAHHFRNQASKRYRKLFDMLEGKRVFLLTATPVNNSLLDLQHLLELFSRRQADYFKTAPLGVHSLPGHFRRLENALEQLTGHGALDADISLADAEKLLTNDPLTQRLVVQRSRAYARRSQEQQGVTTVTFPTREPPQVGRYSLKKTYGGLLDKLRQAFFRQGKPPLLSLAIYNPVAYSTDPAKVEDFVRGRQGQIVGLIRTQLLKRFESSAVAFQATCERLLLKLLAFVTVNSQSKAEKTWLDRWQARHSDLLTRVKTHLHPDAEADEDAEDDVLPPEFLETAEVLSRLEYKVEEIVSETQSDLDQLVIFLDELEDFSAATDDKIQTLLGLFKTNPWLKQHKVLIFSEYMETAHYVYEQLKQAGVEPVDEVHSRVERDRGDIITAFSPYYNDSSSPELKDKGATETRVLVSTDVLAEGLNLQDATLLINYDLHWNPVRLMQRIGRVDRRLDPATETRLLADHPQLKDIRGKVRFWNFLPPNELEDLLLLYQRVAHKTLRISKVFGIEGKQLLTDQDNYEALKDFNQTYEGTPSTVEKMRLAYQDLLKAHPNLEAQLARLPQRVFSGRAHPTAGVKAVFFCYSRPAQNASTGQWDLETGDTQWYLYDLASGKIIEDVEQIDAVIHAEPDTPRQRVLDEATLREARLKLEKHLTNTYLKSAQAPMGVKPILKAWLELN
jgi:superfamily II DNA or RNA helicase